MTHFVIIAFRYNVTLFLFSITLSLCWFWSFQFQSALFKNSFYQLYTVASILILFQALVIVLFVF